MRLRVWQFLQSSVIGTFIGILPGTGATAATFVAYSELHRTSPRRDNFGKGGPDGLIASEASNNAVTGGALILTLALGIPGDGGTVVLLDVLTIQGVVPGFDLINNKVQILTGAFLIILIANLLMFGIGMIGARIFARILSAPEPLLMGMILIFALVGAFVVRGNPVDVIGMALGKTFESK